MTTTPAEPRQPGPPASGPLDLDPTPTPIGWLDLPSWARRTYRAERRYYLRLERPRRLTSSRLGASIRPALDRPVFIIGAARSGTTFLGDCIGRLPEISYHHEPPATKAAGRCVYTGEWGYRRSRWFYRTVYAWLLRVELDGGLRLCEKTPTNAFLIDFLVRAFPGASFIHIIRDGRDAAASHIRKPWLRADGVTGEREPGGYLHGPYAPWWVEPGREREFETVSDARRMAWAWRRYTEVALRDGPPLGPERYLELRYEGLVREPAAEAERLLDFLGISAPRSRDRFREACERVEAGSIGSWRTSFSGSEMADIQAEAGDLLARLGYTG